MLKLLRKLFGRLRVTPAHNPESLPPDNPGRAVQLPHRDTPAPTEVSEGNTDADWHQWEEAVARQRLPENYKT